MEYTKGEWKAIEYDEHFDIRAINADGIDGYDADIAHIFKRRNTNNANLIAVAPKMYETLKAVRGVLVIVNDDFLEETILDRLEQIDKAIAKAEGK